MSKAISYQRFSAIHQGKGSTLDRQQQLIDQWFEHHPDIERSNLSATDKGKSAYKGDHLNHGLGLILEAIESGEIKSGDYILVEAIDRIGRLAPLKMVGLIQRIVEAGVVIVTLEDGAEYTEASLNNGMGALFILVGKVQQAHEYSKNLSRRISGAYEKKRIDARQGKSIKLPSPFWLTTEGKLIPEKAEIVLTCIDMYLKGAGTRKILIDLVDQYPVLESIHPTTVVRWLRNRSLIGEWNNKGEHIPKVFDRLIDDATFYRIQKELKSRVKGMSPEESYDLSGLVKCGNCRGKYHFRRKKHSDYVIKYANCSTYLKRGKGHCDNNKTWPYEVLMMIFENSYWECLSDAAISQANSAVNQEIEVLKEQRAEVNAGIERLLDVLVMMPDQQNIKDKIAIQVERMDSLESEIRSLEDDAISGVGLDAEELNAICDTLDGDPVYRRGLLAKAGYSIKGCGDMMTVEAGPANELIYTLVKRSTKHNCYFVEEFTAAHSMFEMTADVVEDYPEQRIKMAISRDGVVYSCEADTWDEFEKRLADFKQ